MAKRKLMKDIKQAQLARLEIISDLYKRGYNFREMRSEVMRRLELATYSLETVHKDVCRLLEEWKKHRISKIDQIVQLELQRNDTIIKEAWEAWDKSKTDYERRSAKQYGTPGKEDGGEERISTTKIEQRREMVRKNGDPRYLEIILKVQERNAKLLGYDKPIKVDIYSALPKEESPAGVQYDVNALPVDMLVEMAYKLQDAEFEKRQEEISNGKEADNERSSNEE